MANTDKPVVESAALATVNAGALFIEGTDDFSIDKMWIQSDTPDVQRWNKQYPYQFVLAKRSGNGSYETTGQVFTLPIAPESMSISTPFAIATNITFGGVVEEHSGAPVKQISLSGTTGVMPLRATGTLKGSTSFVNAAFAGTIQTAQGVADAAKGFKSALSGFSGLTTSAPNLFKNQDISTSSTNIGSASGYFQFRLLQNFLESYAALKKTSAGKDYRLAFCIWKDESVYLVTPQAFNLSRSAADPYSYNYSITLKAWRRVTLTGATGTELSAYTPIMNSPNALANSLKAIQQARRTLQMSRAVLGALSGDIDRTVFEPLRQTALFIKDVLGTQLAMVDLPTSILKNMRGPIIEWASVRDSIDSGFRKQWDAKVGAIGTASQDAAQSWSTLGTASTKSSTLSADLAPLMSWLGDPGQKDLWVDKSQKPILDQGPHIANSANDPFNNPGDYFDLYEWIKPGELRLSPALQQQINQSRNKAKSLKRSDFEKFRDSIEQVLLDFCDALGVDNATYNTITNRTPRAQSRPITDKDYEIMYVLNQAIIEMNRFAANENTNRFRLESMDLVAAQAAQSGIPFEKALSKFAVPFPYGSSLESLALRYLGNADRWHEIAVLNSLRSPYVDEVGFDMFLLTNGNLNSVTVADASNLYVNQLVWLSSNTTSRNSRHIVGIEEMSPSVFVVTLDGDPDLDKYTVAGKATLHAFLPGTINSQQLIYIPSKKPIIQESFDSKPIPGVNELDPLLPAGGMDFLLDQNNDLILTPDGDTLLAVGLTNIIQMARVRLSIPRGKLLQHPSIGLGLQPGVNTADLDASELVVAAKGLFADDPTYITVTGAAASKDGPVASLGISIEVAGFTQPIPLTFKLG